MVNHHHWTRNIVSGGFTEQQLHKREAELQRGARTAARQHMPVQDHALASGTALQKGRVRLFVSGTANAANSNIEASNHCANAEDD